MEKKVGRNDPCPCGSGKKYKQCCLKNEKVESKYTQAGKRKFKAKVLSGKDTSQQNVFNRSAQSPIFSPETKSFKMTGKDYQDEVEPETQEKLEEEVQQPTPTTEPKKSLHEEFESTKEDFESSDE